MSIQIEDTAFGSLACLFWNVNRHDRRELVCELAAIQRADIIVLAEHGADAEATLASLQQNVDEGFLVPRAKTPRLQLFSRRHRLDLQEVYGDALGRVSIRVLRHFGKEFLFAAVHLPSKMKMSAADQTVQAHILGDDIRREENRRGHRRTILVGDLNMNPFEDGVVGAKGLHGMMARATASEGGRTVQQIEYPFFYNPMWGFFGDRTQGAPGTYHYRSGFVSYDWNMFDQVLVRPAVFPWFPGDVQIVSRIGGTELDRPNGRPNADIGSDHFPIVFRLAAKEE